MTLECPLVKSGSYRWSISLKVCVTFFVDAFPGWYTQHIQQSVYAVVGFRKV